MTKLMQFEKKRGRSSTSEAVMLGDRNIFAQPDKNDYAGSLEETEFRRKQIESETKEESFE